MDGGGAPVDKLVLEGKAGWDVYEMPWPLLDERETFLAQLGEWFSRHDGLAIRLTVEVVEPTSAAVPEDSDGNQPTESSGGELAR